MVNRDAYNYYIITLISVCSTSLVKFSYANARMVPVSTMGTMASNTLVSSSAHARYANRGEL